MRQYFIIIILLLMSACSPKTDKKPCQQLSDCAAGEVCWQGYCEKAQNSCIAGQVRPCYSGPADKKGIGICKEGIERCSARGTWTGVCEGEVKPAQEVCDGKDNDCDGVVDNIGQKKVETCDGIDNDCDGKIDNIAGSDKPLTRECYTGPPNTKGKGPCVGGTQVCTNGQWDKKCQGEVLPKEEICRNQIDDDCDGIVDNVKDLGKPCTDPNLPTACQRGTWACDPRTGVRYCRPLQAKPEECNGQDDDCDGKIDNIRSTNDPITRKCAYKGPAGTEGVGICKAATQRCENGQWSTQCFGEVQPQPEKCNGKDDNCDGKIDNAPGGGQLSQPCYTGAPETRGKGECRDGKKYCVKGTWGKCQGQILPREELCANGKDENCDGKIDNVEHLGAPCLDDGRKGACRQGILECQGTKRVCKQTGKATPEKCNGLDDDCDGLIDNQKGKTTPITRNCYTGPANTKGKGICRGGTQTCIMGHWSSECRGEITPHVELCNAQDDDCDGAIDEAPACSKCSTGSRSCYPGPINTRNRGECKDGKELCQQGRWSGTCTGAIIPKKESCNNKDDDCDGRVDNQPGTTLPLTRPCFTGNQGHRNKGLCADGIQRCIQGFWDQNCLWEQKPTPEICDQKDNDCDGSIDEDNVCHRATRRKLKELCNSSPTAPNYEKCDFGLLCIQASENDYRSYCYQPCSSNGACAQNSDGRTICVSLGEHTNICIRRSDEGSFCDIAQGYLCKPGSFCDMNLHRCRRPSEAKPFEACGGQTGYACPPHYTCVDVSPGAPHGYCLKQCTGTRDCGGGFCYAFTQTQRACLPVGKQKLDSVCGTLGGSKLDTSKFCAKGLLCARPFALNPYGVCVPAYGAPNCTPQSCLAGRVCAPYGNGGIICLRACANGRCPSGQFCINIGGFPVCLAKSPVGPVPFGGVCNPSNRCITGLSCFGEARQSSGFCTKISCKTTADCPHKPAGAQCQALQGGMRVCVFPCRTNNDCPSGLICPANLGRCTAP